MGVQFYCLCFSPTNGYARTWILSSINHSTWSLRFRHNNCVHRSYGQTCTWSSAIRADVACPFIDRVQGHISTPVLISFIRVLWSTCARLRCPLNLSRPVIPTRKKWIRVYDALLTYLSLCRPGSAKSLFLTRGRATSISIVSTEEHSRAVTEQSGCSNLRIRIRNSSRLGGAHLLQPFFLPHLFPSIGAYTYSGWIIFSSPTKLSSSTMMRPRFSICTIWSTLTGLI